MLLAVRAVRQEDGADVMCRMKIDASIGYLRNMLLSPQAPLQSSTLPVYSYVP